MNPNFSMYELTELTKASRDLYNDGLMPAEEVKFFRKLLNDELI